MKLKLMHTLKTVMLGGFYSTHGLHKLSRCFLVYDRERNMFYIDSNGNRTFLLKL